MVLGWPWTIACLVASLVLLRSSVGRRRLGWSILAVVTIAAVMAFGPSIPIAGTLFYPLRFTPLFAVATAPLLGQALGDLARIHRLAGQVAGAALAAMALLVNGLHFQATVPMATTRDLAAIACLDRSVPRDALILGAYGDATQWIPALTGHPISEAHPHISLNDEISALVLPPPTYLFLGERQRYGERPKFPTPVGEPICRAGKAALYRLVNTP
jgi:hypothetical protein